MKVIAVTGTPGTGKTAVAKRLAKKNRFLYLDGKKLIENFRLRERYDRKRKTFVVDEKKFVKLLINVINAAKQHNVKGLVIDSHLGHYLPRKYADLVVVTKTDLKKLQQRLKKRRYPALKIRENLEAEIFDTCYEEAKELKHRIKVVWT